LAEQGKETIKAHQTIARRGRIAEVSYATFEGNLTTR
jgi:hypothetical protein